MTDYKRKQGTAEFPMHPMVDDREQTSNDKLPFPILVKPTFTLDGAGSGVANSDTELLALLIEALRLSPVSQVLIESYLFNIDLEEAKRRFNEIPEHEAPNPPIAPEPHPREYNPESTAIALLALIRKEGNNLVAIAERLRQFQVASTAALQQEVEQLKHVKAGWKDGECFICKGHTSSLAGNPGMWPLWLTYKNGNGKFRCYHFHCVTDAIAKVT